MNADGESSLVSGYKASGRRRLAALRAIGWPDVQPLQRHQGQAAIIQVAQAMRDHAGNLPFLSEIYPDGTAPIARMEGGERVLATAPWGMPSSAFAIEGKKVDRGVTNIRNTASPALAPLLRAGERTPDPGRRLHRLVEQAQYVVRPFGKAPYLTDGRTTNGAKSNGNLVDEI